MAVETGRPGVPGNIRQFRLADIEQARKILADSAEAANWTEASYAEALESKGAVALVAEAHSGIVGFLIGRQVTDEAEILNLAVKRDSRRRGEGSALLQCALDEFRRRRANRLFLEVRESNAAGIAFYTRNGFSRTGRRPDYYRTPNEAAILMEKKLTG